MKSVSVIFKSQLIALLILLCFYSCDDIPEYKLRKKIEDDPLTSKNFQLCPDSDIDCGLLTRDRRQEWILIKIIDQSSGEILFDMWSDSDETEILTFTYNYTFQRRCPYNGEIIGEFFLFSWSVTETYGKKILNIELIGDQEPPDTWMDWLDGIIFIQHLSDYTLRIMINDIIREYEVYYDWKLYE